MQDPQKPVRGLPAIHHARELRAARKNAPAASGKFWVWSAIAVAALSIFYWKKTQTENDAQRTRLLARQRGVAAELGPLYFPLRDKVEAWAIETATGDWQNEVRGDRTSAVARANELLKQPGVYLRVALPDATDRTKLRAAATESLIDEFALRFVRNAGPDPHAGKACAASKECAPGELCNEIGHCAAPSQPYNLRIAYRGTRVLNDAWVRDVETADEELRLRMFERDLESSVENDVAITIDMLRRARYFLVVVDAPPAGLVADKDTTFEQTTQGEPHEARVALYDVARGERIARVREWVDVTGPVVPGDVAAQRRQIFNYELARLARRDMGLE